MTVLHHDLTLAFVLKGLGLGVGAALWRPHDGDDQKEG